jgi:hypothetical protein
MFANWFGFKSDYQTSYLLRGLCILPGLFASDYLRLDISRPLLGLSLLQCFSAVLWLALLAQALIKRPFKQSTVLKV